MSISKVIFVVVRIKTSSLILLVCLVTSVG